MGEVEEAIEKYQGLVPLVYDIETMSLAEARPQDMPYAVYLKREADKVIAEKDKEIAELKKQVHDYAQGLYVIQARAETEARHEKSNSNSTAQ